MKKLFYYILLLLMLLQCNPVPDCKKYEIELIDAKNQILDYQNNFTNLNNTLLSLKSVRDSLQNVVSLLSACPENLNQVTVTLENIKLELESCAMKLAECDDYHDTVYVSTLPFILKQNCMFYIVDTFTFGENIWYIVDMGNESNDTIMISYRDKTYYFNIFHFKADTIINRTNTVYEHNQTVNTPVISALVIKATGTICENDYPVLNIFVNGNHVKNIEINSSDSLYISIIDKPFDEISSLKLVFDNDCYIPGKEDRNITIKSIMINNQELINKVTLSGAIAFDGNEIVMLSNGAIQWLK